MNTEKKYTTQIIKNQTIYFDENGYKFKFYENMTNKSRRICMFDQCTNMVQRGLYCMRHINNTNYAKITFDSTYEDENGIIQFDNQEYRDKCKNAAKIGEETENYILDILKENKNLEMIEKIGYTGDKNDIIYKFKNTEHIRGIQVKTMRSNLNDVYRCTLNRNNTIYNDDMLFVLVNKERNRFCLIFYKDCPKSGPTLPFKSIKTSKYRDNMFIDIDEFKNKLYEMMKDSNIYKEDISKTTKKEKDSVNRLKEACIKYNLPFVISESFISIYDCLINNHKVQCRSSNQEHGYQYNFSLSKSHKMIHFKKTSRKYNEDDDIDIFIFEIISQPNIFYIIPKNILVEKGYIESKNYKGKTGITIPLVGNTNKNLMSYWTLDYVNRFDLLKE
jgi:hypothetical protein